VLYQHEPGREDFHQEKRGVTEGYPGLVSLAELAELAADFMI
jgi:hypothetical protein